MMLCIHKWEIKSEERFDEALSKFLGYGLTMSGFTAGDLAKRGLITTAQCSKCSKVKHIKTVLE